MISRWSWLALAAACHDPAAPVAPAPVAAVPVAAVPVAASPPPTAPAPDPTPEPPPPVVPETPKACAGDSIDLLALRKIDACATEAQAHIPDNVTVSIEPATIVVKGGKTLPATLVVSNPTRDTVDLVVDDSCNALSEIETSMIDDRGTRVDEGPPTCGGMTGCARSRIAFALTPGGTARLPFVVDARVMVFDNERCTPYRSSRAVRPGTYQLVVAGPLGKVQGSVRIR